jgi:HAE1 family hydrophobic/amphiphilic exporter-1
MIAETFINRPVTAIVVSIVIALLGGICVLTLPVNQYPKITPPAVSVSANYTGADAITVEQTVATPVEEAINGVKGMEYIQSNSTSTGLMLVNATFKVGTNVDIATLDVQNRVGIAKPLLPSTVSRLGLTVRARNIIISPSLIIMPIFFLWMTC